MFAKRCRVLHTSRIRRKRRHKDPSCVRVPFVGLVIVVLADHAETADHIHKDVTDRYTPYLHGGPLRALLQLAPYSLRCSCDVEMSFNNNIRVISKHNYSTS